jgi:hypothetical protein
MNFSRSSQVGAMDRGEAFMVFVYYGAKIRIICKLVIKTKLYYLPVQWHIPATSVMKDLLLKLTTVPSSFLAMAFVNGTYRKQKNEKKLYLCANFQR